ncbi:MAG: winged helix-turn-helix transcriptional regulator [Clostridia bacterium]|nr:winged helix-turn-helix transcriptional regulator [Clostridia bacterium]
MEHCELEGLVAPREEELYDLADFFKIFADSTRIRILFALDGKSLCVSDISELLDISISCVSHQLKILRTSNLIKSERRGKNVYYSLVDCHVHDILQMALLHIEE